MYGNNFNGMLIIKRSKAHQQVNTKKYSSRWINERVKFRNLDMQTGQVFLLDYKIKDKHT